MHVMVDFALLQSIASAMTSSFVTKDEVARYLEEQAEELSKAVVAISSGEEAASATESVTNAAETLAALARRHDLEVLALRFDALGKGASAA